MQVLVLIKWKSTPRIQWHEIEETQQLTAVMRDSFVSVMWDNKVWASQDEEKFWLKCVTWEPALCTRAERRDWKAASGRPLRRWCSILKSPIFWTSTLEHNPKPRASPKRNFGDLDWFVGAHRMEDLLNSLIESWEVCIPWYMRDTHAHDPEGIGNHFPVSANIWILLPAEIGNSQDESATFPGHFLVHRLIAGGFKLQSDCHPMVANLDRPWGIIHRLIMN